MKRLLFLLAGVTAGAVTFADDLVITEAGERTLTPGDAYGKLVNNVASSEVVLKSSGDAVEADKVSFTGFDAAANAKTAFYGGYWDFGALSNSQLNFFTNTATASNRTTVFTNGAVAVGIGDARLAGSSGTDNTLTLADGSSMSVASMTLGEKGSDQRSQLNIEGGASLACSGAFYMTRFQVASDTGGRYQTGNELNVRGAGSKVTVGGTLSVGGKKDGTFGYGGGNTVEVTDGASAEFADIDVSGAARMGQRNHLRFGKDARVTMSSLTLSTGGTSGYSAASNLVEIVDGAVVTNTGAFTFGESSSQVRGHNTLIVSNAEFRIYRAYDASVGYLLCGPYSEIRLSGKDAKFSAYGKSISAWFKGSHCTFTVENGCTFDWKNTTYSYTVACDHETVLVRNRGTLLAANNFSLGKSGNGGSYNCLRVIDDSAFTNSATFGANAHFSGVEVSDSSFKVSQSATFGGSFTNCYLRIAGSHPVVNLGWGVTFGTNAELRVTLPKNGYDAGYATYDRPVLHGAHVSAEQQISFYSSAKLVLDGVEDFVKWHYDNFPRQKKSYYLAKANHIGGAGTNNFANVAASLPPSVQFKWYNGADGMAYIRLDVKPKYGLQLLVR